MLLFNKPRKAVSPVSQKTTSHRAEETITSFERRATPPEPAVDLLEFYKLEPELKPYLAYSRPEIPNLLGYTSQGRSPSYEVFSQSVIGQRHINEGMEKEDSCEVWADFENGVLSFALGDGHGDANCVRSKIGSELVAQIAIMNLQKLVAGLMNEKRTELLYQKDWQEIFLRQVILSIKTGWDQAVLKHLKENPLTDAEWAQCDTYLESYRNEKSLEHLYGTTLIAGIATKEYLILLQQGDGRCDVFHADGSVDQPIPWDDDCIGNATTSMCQPDTWKRCRYCVIDLRKDPVVACFAGSDGVEDSFRTMDDVHTYYRNLLLYALEHGTKELEQYLKTELTRLNQAGSMDDTTVVGIADLSAAKSLRNIYETRNRAYLLQCAWDRADEALRSKEGRKTYLEQKYIETKRRFTSLQQQAADFFRYYNAEQFLCKMERSDHAVQNITDEEYHAAKEILNKWLAANVSLQGKREEYQLAGRELEKWEKEYQDCCFKYVELQREKAGAARNFEILLASLQKVTDFG